VSVLLSLPRPTYAPLTLFYGRGISEMEGPDAYGVVKPGPDGRPIGLNLPDVAGTDHPVGISSTVGQDLPHSVRRDRQLFRGDG
jgi:hypothetical protein